MTDAFFTSLLINLTICLLVYCYHLLFEYHCCYIYYLKSEEILRTRGWERK